MVTTPAWLTLALAIPVLVFGEALVNRSGVLARFAIPAPVVGGLVAAVAVLACIKAGASYGLQSAGLTFPIVMGGMLVGVAARNILDACQFRWFAPVVLERIASLALGLFLATAMMTLNLIELGQTVLPMLAILAVQVGVMVAYAGWITFPLMGRDHEASVIAAGHIGFGLGSTTTAVANMKAMVETSGPAPRAFLIVPAVGSFLVDLANALTITAFLNVAT